MIIGSCGYGATGSSVLTDLLCEYDNIQVFDSFEFTLAYKVDGLQDLEYHLMKQYSKNISGDYAIKRFLESSKSFKTPFINKPCNGKKFQKLSEEFIDNIVQIKYKGIESADMYTSNVVRNIFAFASKKVLMPKIVEKITHKRSYLWPSRYLYYSIKPDNFYEEAKKYIKNILIEMGADLDKPICLDQPFEGNAPEQSFPFFENPYAIVIDRDPRDLYLEYKYTTHPDEKFFPYKNVYEFIIFYKKMRSNNESDRVLRVNFEDFIYEYKQTVNKIEKYLKLATHKCPYKYFDPTKSINNTQKFLKYSDEKENIKIIEKELKEYLYPFEKYPELKPNGKSFTGAGRKIHFEED